MCRRVVASSRRRADATDGRTKGRKSLSVIAPSEFPTPKQNRKRHMAVYIVVQVYKRPPVNFCFACSLVRSFVFNNFCGRRRCGGGLGRSAATAARRLRPLGGYGRSAGPPPWRRRPQKLRKKISDFCKNLGFSRKSQIFAKILDFHENLGFLRKSRIFAKISDFCENLGFSRKSRIS